MYNPSRFKSTDENELFEFLEKNPFATLISVAGGEPRVSHLPLVPLRVGGSIELVGHLARANQHWKVLAGGVLTVIFHGPHTFITPVWYKQHDVPTWNYVTAHLRGRCDLIESTDGIAGCLRLLTAHAEKHWPSGWEFLIPDDLAGDLLAKHIVGFKIVVESFEFKKKLGQNRSPEDYQGVIDGLESRSDEMSALIRAEMLKLKK